MATRYQFVDDSGETRLAGVLQPEPSGASSVTVALSSTDILALFTSPKQLVAAPGAGKIVVPLAVFAFYTHVTADYVMNDGYGFSYASAAYYLAGSPMAIDGSASNGGVFAGITVGANATNGLTSAGMANKALLFRGDSNPTGGDGTASVTVVYVVGDLT